VTAAVRLRRPTEIRDFQHNPVSESSKTEGERERRGTALT